MVLDAARERIALFARQARREMLHHRGICVESGEGLTVLDAPTPQPQTRRFDFDARRHQKSRCKIPRSSAIVTACVRSEAFSFARMFWMCILMVPLAVPR